MKILRALLPLFSLVVIWELVAAAIDASPNPLPPPSVFLPDVLSNGLQIGIGSQSTGLFEAIFSSVVRVVVGILLSGVIGIPLGIVIARIKLARNLLLPMVRLFAPIAPIAWIPIALAILGIGNQTAVFIVVMGVAFIFILTIVQAIDAISQDISDTAATLGCSPFYYQVRVVIPAILPSLISSMRVNFAAAWMAVLAAEMTGLRDGLGAIVMTGRNLYDYNLITFGIFLIAVIGMAMDSALTYIHSKYFWW